MSRTAYFCSTFVCMLFMPADAFRISVCAQRSAALRSRTPLVVCDASEESPQSAEIVPIDVVTGETTKFTEEEVREVGNLAADDEWLGLTMELAIVLRSAVREGVKKNVREFTGSDEYKLGDLSKEADARIKEAVANMRGKEDYELGDLTLAIDQLAKDEVNKLTGKEEYEAVDLSIEVDRRIKSTVADFCGKEEYEAGDLTKEISTRVEKRVVEFTGSSEYNFGDISREINRRRAEWVQEYVGKQGDEYEFGDVTKTFIRNFTGKEDYEFGDLTKKAVKNFTGKDSYEFVRSARSQRPTGTRHAKLMCARAAICTAG